tara:strand:- start:747 stop:1571 length:825 start_codon:yes stop_codon:yes gene_type:complete
MPFIGNQPANAFTSFAKQDFTTSATTSYSLDNAVANANELALFINFVRQEPTTAYSASGTTLTLTSATASSDDMYCVFLGKALQTVNPADGSVGTSQLSDGAVTGAKVISGMPVKFTRVPVVPVNFTTTAFLPRDNTVPLINEGGQVLQYDYTPALSSSTIMIWTHFHMAEVANVGNAFAGALFVNNTCVNVRATTGMSASGDGDAAHIFLETQFSNSDGSAVDIEIRADSANNYSINPQHLSTANDAAYTVAGSSFGGTDAINGTYLFIMEIK